jgi:outer membrane lipoprotein SlyB
MNENERTENADRDDRRRINDPNAENRDDHPVGTVTGTGAGATTGAVAGLAMGGPAGAVVGSVIGGVVGGLAGHGAAEAVNPEGDKVSGNRIPDPGSS